MVGKHGRKNQIYKKKLKQKEAVVIGYATCKDPKLLRVEEVSS